MIQPSVDHAAYLKNEVGTLLLKDKFVYWRELVREPQPIMRVPFEGGRPTAVTPAGELILDMRFSGDALVYTMSPSGDSGQSDSRVVRLDADGKSTVLVDHQWQAARPMEVGSDLYWVTGLDDLVLITAATPQRARIHRKSANGAITTFDRITAFGHYVVLPQGILTVSMLRQKLTFHPFDGGPSRDLFVGEGLSAPAIDANGVVYIATSPKIATPTDRILRIVDGKVEEYVTGSIGYNYLQFVGDQLYFRQDDGIMRKSPASPPERIVPGKGIEKLAASREGVAWVSGTYDSWTIKTSDLSPAPPDPLR